MTFSLCIVWVRAKEIFFHIRFELSKFLTYAHVIIGQFDMRSLLFPEMVLATKT